MEMDTLRDLYIDELKDLYSAEKQLVKALPKMVRLATAPALKEAFANHLEETKGHVERLERIFGTLDASPRGKKCVGMEGLVEEGSALMLHFLSYGKPIQPGKDSIRVEDRENEYRDSA